MGLIGKHPLNVLIAAFRHDRRRPIPTHKQLLATKTGFYPTRVDSFRRMGICNGLTALVDPDLREKAKT
jgi:hypothetical protein